MRWWTRLRKGWRYAGEPWEAAVVGQESGYEHRLPFARFRTREEAESWVDKMNARNAEREQTDPLTVMEVRQRYWYD